MAQAVTKTRRFARLANPHAFNIEYGTVDLSGKDEPKAETGYQAARLGLLQLGIYGKKVNELINWWGVSEPEKIDVDQARNLIGAVEQSLIAGWKETASAQWARGERPISKEDYSYLGDLGRNKLRYAIKRPQNPDNPKYLAAPAPDNTILKSDDIHEYPIGKVTGVGVWGRDEDGNLLTNVSASKIYKRMRQLTGNRKRQLWGNVDETVFPLRQGPESQGHSRGTMMNAVALLSGDAGPSGMGYVDFRGDPNDPHSNEVWRTRSRDMYADKPLTFAAIGTRWKPGEEVKLASEVQNGLRNNWLTTELVDIEPFKGQGEYENKLGWRVVTRESAPFSESKTALKDYSAKVLLMPADLSGLTNERGQKLNSQLMYGIKDAQAHVNLLFQAELAKAKRIQDPAARETALNAIATSTGYSSYKDMPDELQAFGPRIMENWWKANADRFIQQVTRPNVRMQRNLLDAVRGQIVGDVRDVPGQPNLADVDLQYSAIVGDIIARTSQVYGMNAARVSYEDYNTLKRAYGPTAEKYHRAAALGQQPYRHIIAANALTKGVTTDLPHGRKALTIDDIRPQLITAMSAADQAALKVGREGDTGFMAQQVITRLSSMSIDVNDPRIGANVKRRIGLQYLQLGNATSVPLKDLEFLKAEDPNGEEVSALRLAFYRTLKAAASGDQEQLDLELQGYDVTDAEGHKMYDEDGKPRRVAGFIEEQRKVAEGEKTVQKATSLMLPRGLGAGYEVYGSTLLDIDEFYGPDGNNRANDVAIVRRAPDAPGWEDIVFRRVTKQEMLARGEKEENLGRAYMSVMGQIGLAGDFDQDLISVLTGMTTGENPAYTVKDNQVYRNYYERNGRNWQLQRSEAIDTRQRVQQRIATRLATGAGNTLEDFPNLTPEGARKLVRGEKLTAAEMKGMPSRDELLAKFRDNAGLKSYTGEQMADLFDKSAALYAAIGPNYMIGKRMEAAATDEAARFGAAKIQAAIYDISQRPEVLPATLERLKKLDQASFGSKSIAGWDKEKGGVPVSGVPGLVGLRSNLHQVMLDLAVAKGGDEVAGSKDVRVDTQYLANAFGTTPENRATYKRILDEYVGKMRGGVNSDVATNAAMLQLSDSKIVGSDIDWAMQSAIGRSEASSMLARTKRNRDKTRAQAGQKPISNRELGQLTGQFNEYQVEKLLHMDERIRAEASLGITKGGTAEELAVLQSLSGKQKIDMGTLRHETKPGEQPVTTPATAPGITTPTAVAAAADSSSAQPAQKYGAGTAIWRNKDVDMPIGLTGNAHYGSNRWWYEISDSNTFVSENEINDFVAAQPANSTPAATPQQQTTKAPGYSETRMRALSNIISTHGGVDLPAAQEVAARYLHGKTDALDKLAPDVRDAVRGRLENWLTDENSPIVVATPSTTTPSVAQEATTPPVVTAPPASGGGQPPEPPTAPPAAAAAEPEKPRRPQRMLAPEDIDALGVRIGNVVGNAVPRAIAQAQRDRFQATPITPAEIAEVNARVKWMQKNVLSSEAAQRWEDQGGRPLNPKTQALYNKAQKHIERLGNLMRRLPNQGLDNPAEGADAIARAYASNQYGGNILANVLGTQGDIDDQRAQVFMEPRPQELYDHTRQIGAVLQRNVRGPNAAFMARQLGDVIKLHDANVKELIMPDQERVQRQLDDDIDLARKDNALSALPGELEKATEMLSQFTKGLERSNKQLDTFEEELTTLSEKSKRGPLSPEDMDTLRFGAKAIQRAEARAEGQREADGGGERYGKTMARTAKMRGVLEEIEEEQEGFDNRSRRGAKGLLRRMTGLGDVGWTMFNVQRWWRWTGGAVAGWSDQYAQEQMIAQQAAFEGGGANAATGAAGQVLRRKAQMSFVTSQLGEAANRRWGGTIDELYNRFTDLTAGQQEGIVSGLSTAGILGVGGLLAPLAASRAIMAGKGLISIGTRMAPLLGSGIAAGGAIGATSGIAAGVLGGGALFGAGALLYPLIFGQAQSKGEDQQKIQQYIYENATNPLTKLAGYTSSQWEFERNGKFLDWIQGSGAAAWRFVANRTDDYQKLYAEAVDAVKTGGTTQEDKDFLKKAAERAVDVESAYTVRLLLNKAAGEPVKDERALDFMENAFLKTGGKPEQLGTILDNIPSMFGSMMGTRETEEIMYRIGTISSGQTERLAAAANVISPILQQRGVGALGIYDAANAYATQYQTIGALRYNASKDYNLLGSLGTLPNTPSSIAMTRALANTSLFGEMKATTGESEETQAVADKLLSGLFGDEIAKLSPTFLDPEYRGEITPEIKRQRQKLSSYSYYATEVYAGRMNAYEGKLRAARELGDYGLAEQAGYDTPFDRAMYEQGFNSLALSQDQRSKDINTIMSQMYTQRGRPVPYDLVTNLTNSSLSKPFIQQAAAVMNTTIGQGLAAFKVSGQTFNAYGGAGWQWGGAEWSPQMGLQELGTYDMFTRNMNYQQMQNNFSLDSAQRGLAMHGAQVAYTRRIRGIEDRQIAASRKYDLAQIGLQAEARDLGYSQSVESAGMSYRHSMENVNASIKEAQLRRQYQEEDYSRSRFQAGRQRTWQREDYTYRESMAGLSYSWGMEDLNRAIGFASGRQRQDLIRQRDRNQISYSMESGQRGRERSRFEEQAKWQDEDFEKQRKRMNELNSLQDEAFSRQRRQVTEGHEMQMRHLSENYALQKKRADAEKEHMITMNTLEDERRVEDRKWQDAQLADQQKDLENRLAMAKQAKEDFDTWKIYQEKIMQANKDLQDKTLGYIGPDGKLTLSMETFIDNVGDLTIAEIKRIQDAVSSYLDGLKPPSGSSGSGTTTPPGGPPKMAAGGIVTQRTPVIVGEAGPEAIIPLAKAPQIIAQYQRALGETDRSEYNAPQITIYLGSEDVTNLVSHRVVRSPVFESGLNDLARRQRNR